MRKDNAFIDKVSSELFFFKEDALSFVKAFKPNFR